VSVEIATRGVVVHGQGRVSTGPQPECEKEAQASLCDDFQCTHRRGADDEATAAAFGGALHQSTGTTPPLAEIGFTPDCCSSARGSESCGAMYMPPPVVPATRRAGAETACSAEREDARDEPCRSAEEGVACAPQALATTEVCGSQEKDRSSIFGMLASMVSGTWSPTKGAGPGGKDEVGGSGTSRLAGDSDLGRSGRDARIEAQDFANVHNQTLIERLREPEGAAGSCRGSVIFDSRYAMLLS
jgi:hypothetical protein